MNLIEEWIYYLWLIPQTISFTIDTFDRVNMTASMDMIYGTYLLPHLSLGLAWKLQSNSYLMANFNLPAILGILILAFIFSRLRSHWHHDRYYKLRSVLREPSITGGSFNKTPPTGWSLIGQCCRGAINTRWGWDTFRLLINPSPILKDAVSTATLSQDYS